MDDKNHEYPFAPIKSSYTAQKTKAWHYKAHPYYTKQPSNVVSEYINYFCPKNGLVADPFCGSGVTAIEALVNRRRAIAIDLEPLAVFITKQTCRSPVNLDDFTARFMSIKESLTELAGFVRNASDSEINSFEIKKWYPKNIRLPLNADRNFVENLFFKDNLIILAYLHDEIRKTDNNQVRDLLLFAFSGILHRASLTYIEWQGSGGHSTIFQQYRYYVPKVPGKLDVWGLFERKCNNLKKIKEQSNKLIGDYFEEGSTFNAYCDSAEELLKYTGEKSVDYIYTDPPYGAHISYLDLSAIYHAWLDFDVPEENYKKEAIEGGDLKLDESHYLNSLQNAFEQMFVSLKDNAWLSLVFMHKKTSLWYSIRDVMRYIGFKYENTVVQPLSWASWHKKTNPLKVLGDSLIVNFRKSPQKSFSKPLARPLANIIKNVAERVIYKNGGATTEEIIREVIPDLFENDMFIDAASTKVGDFNSILQSDFDRDENDLWQIRKERKVGNFIPPKIRIQYYLVGYLKRREKATFDEIVTTILPLLINGHKPTREDILDVLKEIGYSSDNKYWQLKDDNFISTQAELPLIAKSETSELELYESTIHNQHIYRLAIMCQKAGFIPFIGKRERNDPMLSILKTQRDFTAKIPKEDRSRIEQIDLIWLDNSGKSYWAFEIEMHTSILSALERFTFLLKIEPNIGREHRLTVVSPKSRTRKLEKELTSSSYIGHPLYLENKISYLFTEELEVLFKRSQKAAIDIVLELEKSIKMPRIE